VQHHVHTADPEHRRIEIEPVEHRFVRPLADLRRIERGIVLEVFETADEEARVPQAGSQMRSLTDAP
jgi:hypothetical protein